MLPWSKNNTALFLWLLQCNILVHVVVTLWDSWSDLLIAGWSVDCRVLQILSSSVVSPAVWQSGRQQGAASYCFCSCVLLTDCWFLTTLTGWNPGNLPEFEIAPGNTGNLPEFSWCCWKQFYSRECNFPTSGDFCYTVRREVLRFVVHKLASGLDGTVTSVGQSPSSLAHL